MTEVAAGSLADRSKVAPVKDFQRSPITNGTKLLVGVDGRNTWVRRAKDLIREHTQDLGGPDAISAGERSVVRRIAAVTVELESLEARFALAGIADPSDLALYFQGSNNLRRLLEAVGLKRRPRNVTPQLREYLDHTYPQQTIDDDDEVDQ